MPKELEEQLEYENLPDMVRQSDSFGEGIEYHILRKDKLLQLKTLLNSRNTIPQVRNSINRVPSLILLTEAGLYTVMFLSRKTNAQILVGQDNDTCNNFKSCNCSGTGNCVYCGLIHKIKRINSTRKHIKTPYIVFVPVRCLESWLLFGAKKKRENYPEDINSSNMTKEKFCGVHIITKRILNEYHIPVSERIDVDRLIRLNVKSFDKFYTQIKCFMKRKREKENNEHAKKNSN